MRSDALGEETKSEPAPRRRRKSRISPNLQPEGTPRIRYRVRFAKTGLLRWISHRDLASLWERIGRRADLPFSLTEGFHAKPRIAFPSALPLGVESLDEVADIDLKEPWPAEQLLERLQVDDQPGLSINSVELVDMTLGKAQMAGADYHVTLPDDFDEKQAEHVAHNIELLLSKETVSIQRKDKTVSANVATQIPSLRLQTTSKAEDCESDGIYATLFLGAGASLRIHDVLDLLELTDWPRRGATLIRTRTRLKGEPEYP